MSETMTLHTAGRPARWSLRRLLAFDAATGVAMGLLLLAAPATLAAWFALPAGLLWGAGLLLLPCAAVMAAGAAMQRPAPLIAWTVIVGNAAWVLASLVVAFVLYAPSALGLAFLLGQAAVVAALAALERRALARQAA